MDFLGRQYELSYLDKRFNTVQGELCVVYGRRRIGKTRLLAHWLAQRDHQGFYWLATNTTAQALLRSLSQMTYRFIHGQAPTQLDFAYYSWDELFREWIRYAEQTDQKFVIILDEFTYALEAYPDLPYQLQAVWDQHLKTLPIMLILSGSHIGMMEEGILAQRSPLYGRATALLKMQALPFKELRIGFPNYSIAACVALYSVLGGVPYYLERIDPALSVVENIISNIIDDPTLMQDEPRLLLQDHFANPRLQAAIIGQVAQSTHTPKAIAQALDLEPATVSAYLHTLVNLGLLQREVPATERHPERSRKSRYKVTDPFLRFYHRFLLPQLPFIIRGNLQSVWATIETHWRAFVGSHTFEELCREWIYIASENGRLPFLPQVVGSHWSKEAQIDVIAINWDETAVLYGECKWKQEPIRQKEVIKLFTQAEKVRLTSRSGRPLTPHYIFFSRSGFTDNARLVANEQQAILVDLATFDHVLQLAVR